MDLLSQISCEMMRRFACAVFEATHPWTLLWRTRLARTRFRGGVCAHMWGHAPRVLPHVKVLTRSEQVVPMTFARSRCSVCRWLKGKFADWTQQTESLLHHYSPQRRRHEVEFVQIWTRTFAICATKSFWLGAKDTKATSRSSKFFWGAGNFQQACWAIARLISGIPLHVKKWQEGGGFQTGRSKCQTSQGNNSSTKKFSVRRVCPEHLSWIFSPSEEYIRGACAPTRSSCEADLIECEL